MFSEKHKFYSIIFVQFYLQKQKLVSQTESLEDLWQVLQHAFLKKQRAVTTNIDFANLLMFTTPHSGFFI